jgi:hypothetical protein
MCRTSVRRMPDMCETPQNQALRLVSEISQGERKFCRISRGLHNDGRTDFVRRSFEPFPV